MAQRKTFGLTEPLISQQMIDFALWMLEGRDKKEHKCLTGECGHSCRKDCGWQLCCDFEKRPLPELKADWRKTREEDMTTETTPSGWAEVSA
jgi:hypothetical protein